MKTRKSIITVLTFLAFDVTTLAQTVPSYVQIDNLVGYGNNELKNNNSLNIIRDIDE
jgi:hypothetical protein